MSLSIYQKFYKIIIILGVCVISFPVFAQNDGNISQGDFWNHVRFGGGIGLSFGDGFFSGTLAPSAIYQFNNHL